MNRGTGAVLKQIRKSKHLSAANIADNLVRQPQISRFENGKSTLTVDRFLGLLQNMAVTLDEFQSIFNEYNLSEEDTFRMDLAHAYDAKDEEKLKRMLAIWQNKQKMEPQKKYIKINVTVIEVMLSYVSENFKPFKDDIKFLTDYLMNVEDWGRFEFWAFGCCVSVFDNGTLKLLGQEVFHKLAFYKNIVGNYQRVVRVLLNLLAVWIDKGEYHLALKYLKYLENQNLSIELMYERLMLKYNKGRYLYKTGKKEGMDLMKSCSEMLENLGYFDKAKSLTSEIERL